jgi:hypothetical protein
MLPSRDRRERFLPTFTRTLTHGLNCQQIIRPLCSKNIPAQRCGPFFVGQCFQEKVDRFADVGKRFLDGRAFRLATFQIRAPSVTAVLVLFDYDADLPCYRLYLTAGND